MFTKVQELRCRETSSPHIPVNPLRRILIGPTWVMLPLISWPLVADPYFMDSPPGHMHGVGAFPRRKQLGTDRKQLTSTPQRVPSLPLVQSPRSPHFLQQDATWQECQLIAHFRGDLFLDGHHGFQMEPTSFQNPSSFSLPSLA